MNKDKVVKHIQNFFDNNTLLIVGSGLSSAEGIPGMRELADEIISQMDDLAKNDTTVYELWQPLRGDLIKHMNLELAFHRNQPPHNIECLIKKITGNYINKYNGQILNEIITQKRVLKFSNFIQQFNLESYNVNVITTNYDLLIEYACESANIRVDNTFLGKYIALFNPSKSKKAFVKNIRRRGNVSQIEYYKRVNIFKPHGCLSWREINGECYSILNAKTEEYRIITPGVNKYIEGYNKPFDYHREQANKCIDFADKYIFIGYGFNDQHLETHIRLKENMNKPILIITRELTENACKLIKEGSDVMAISKYKDDSLVEWKGTEVVFENCDLWDIQILVEEVFE